MLGSAQTDDAYYYRARARALALTHKSQLCMIIIRNGIDGNARRNGAQYQMISADQLVLG